MDSNIVAVMAILASIIIVVLNYWKELKTRKESELYLRKLKFYEELINYINKALYQEDESMSRELVKLYNKSFIFSSDNVINDLNEFFEKVYSRDKVPHTELKNIYAKIFLDCRHDLGIKTKFSGDGLHDYKAPFK